MKNLIVLKYGGSSVADDKKIMEIAEYVKSLYSSGKKIVIVISAMGKFTNELTEIAYKISPHPLKREMDIILTTGERISMALMSIALNDIGVPAISFTGSQSGIITDCSHTKAKIHSIKPYRLVEELNNDKVVIVAGFQGVSTNKDITTLGRGGSDLSAIALAIALQAERCDINTDVDGIYPIDPRLCPEVEPYDKMDFSEALLFASTGAKVMHDRACSLANYYRLPYYIKSSFNSKGGTCVMALNSPMDKERDVTEKPFIKGITSKKNLICFEFPDHREFIGKINSFSSNDINIFSTVQFQEKSIILLEKDEFQKNNQFFKELRLNPEGNFFTVNILGEGFNNFPGSLQTVYKFLNEFNYEPVLLNSNPAMTTLLFHSDINHDEVIRNMYDFFKSFF